MPADDLYREVHRSCLKRIVADLNDTSPACREAIDELRIMELEDELSAAKDALGELGAKPEAKPTPRTDLHEWTAAIGTDDRTVVWADFARVLERENATLREMAKHACELYRVAYVSGTEDSARVAYAFGELKGAIAALDPSENQSGIT